MKRLFGLEKNNNSQNAQDDHAADGVDAVRGVRGLSCLYSPHKTEVTHIRNVIDVLIEMDKISRDQLDRIRSENTNISDPDIEKLLIGQNLVTANDLRVAKAQLCGFKFRTIRPDEINRDAFNKLDLDYIRETLLMPVDIADNTLILAAVDPTNVFAIDDVKRQTGMTVEIFVCDKQDIEAACEEFDDSKFGYDVDGLISDMTEIEVVQEVEEDSEDLEKSAGESPVIKFVNYIVSKAVREKASDIHIEPKEKYTKIRYRIDGVLFDSMQAPAKMHPAVVSRIKIMANLDISERRVPQDGKIAVRMSGRGVDLRISTLPTTHGEKVVIRILDRDSIMHGLDQSGMETGTLEAFQDQIALPHGILLVTGPTGSGKSTTLYSALGQMDSQTLNVSTVEDPVEYELEFCNQIQVNEKAGLTFAGALRSLLRQDPDIIMVGEIRDSETSRIAVQAALTGHLVLSTLHTNDAPSSISRMVNIGIEPYLIAASLNAVLAQRLVRRICTHCKEVYNIPENMRRHIENIGVDPSQLMHGAGCDHCRGSGYVGRAGIFELLVIDDTFRNIINKDASVNTIRRTFIDSGSPTLFNDGMEKVKQGITTVEEILRVTEANDQAADGVCSENMETVEC